MTQSRKAPLGERVLRSRPQRLCSQCGRICSWLWTGLLDSGPKCCLCGGYGPDASCSTCARARRALGRPM